MVDEGDLSARTATRIAKSISDEKQAVKIAKKIRETPLSEDRMAIIDIARENPSKTAGEIAIIARQRSAMKSIRIHVTQRVYEAIVLASKKYQSDKEDVVKEALEEWLKKRGFIT